MEVIKFREKWTSALRSGEFDKGHGYLRVGDKYCPLGVACELAAREGKISYFIDGGIVPGMDIYVYEFSEQVLPNSLVDALGLLDNSGSSALLGYDLVRLNDGCGYYWPTAERKVKVAELPPSWKFGQGVDFKETADILDSGAFWRENNEWKLSAV